MALKINKRETEGNVVCITLITGLEPTRASHNMRQESSPTLQNSCALQVCCRKVRKSSYLWNWIASNGWVQDSEVDKLFLLFHLRTLSTATSRPGIKLTKKDIRWGDQKTSLIPHTIWSEWDHSCKLPGRTELHIFNCILMPLEYPSRTNRWTFSRLIITFTGVGIRFDNWSAGYRFVGFCVSGQRRYVVLNTPQNHWLVLPCEKKQWLI